MRWYCLDPDLPDEAQLRIRTAPNSDAEECGRVSKGKAISAVAVEFAMEDDALPSDVNTEVLQRWLHVEFVSGDTGKPTEGYMMAKMPSGRQLLVPWEETDCISCCRIVNKRAHLYADPSATASPVGLVNDDLDVQYPYAIINIYGARAHILHHEHGDVWIDRAALEPVCERLHHANCSVQHAVYRVNDALPPEAEIAIRAFPSRDAESYGVLRHGDTIEVVVRCGRWFRAAPRRTMTGANAPVSWIMWEIDEWQLLVEARDVRVNTCLALDDVASGDNKGEDKAALNEQEAEADEAIEAVDSDALSVETTEDESDERRVRAEEDVLQAIDSDIEGQDVEEEPVDSLCAIASSSWDDRPLNVRRNREHSNSSSNSNSNSHTNALDDLHSTAIGSFEIASNETEAAAQDARYDDDRPICPQLSALASDDDASVSEQQQQSNEALDAFVTAEFDSVDDAAETNATESVAADDAPMVTSDVETIGYAPPPVSAWDDVPVGNNTSITRVWDEYPPGYQPTLDAGDDGQASQDDLADAAGTTLAVDDAVPGHDDGYNTNADDNDASVEAMLVDAAASAKAETEAPGDVDGVDSPSAMEDMPVGTISTRGASAWDDVPVGGSSKRVWDEYPPGYQPDVDASDTMDVDTADVNAAAAASDGADGIDACVENSDTNIDVDVNVVDSNDDNDDDATVASIAVDDDDTNRATAADSIELAATALQTTEDETPVDGTNARAGNAWDDVPIGSSNNKRGPIVWEEYPPDATGPTSDDTAAGCFAIGNDVAATSCDADAAVHETSDNDSDGNDVDGFVDSVMVDDDNEEAAVQLPFIKADDDDDATLPQLSLTMPTAWDDVPVGGSTTLPVYTNAWDERPISSSKRGPIVWDEYPPDVAPTIASHDGDDEDNVNYIPDNLTAAPIAQANNERPLRNSNWLESQRAAITETADENGDDAKGKMTLADLDHMDESVVVCEALENEKVNALVEVERDTQPSDRGGALQPYGDVNDELTLELVGDQTSPPSDLVDEKADDNVAAVDKVADENLVDDDMVVEDTLGSDCAAPDWNESPIKPTAQFYEDTTMDDPTGDNDVDDNDMHKNDGSEAADVRVNDDMDSASSDHHVASQSRLHDNDEPRGDVASHVHTTSAAQGASTRRLSARNANVPQRRARKPKFTSTDVGNDGLSFLLEFGIRAYCRHKQILITASDDDGAAQLLFNEVVYGDDPERILEALTANDVPCAAWMRRSPTTTPSSVLASLDSLCKREPPVTPAPSTQVNGQRTTSSLSHARSTRKQKLERMFNRAPDEQYATSASTTTYDLIMNNADVDAILEAAFGSEACELTILKSYKYPTLSATRFVVPAASSRFSNAQPTSSLMPSDSSSSYSSHALLRDDAIVPPRALTPPGGSTATLNPLKRTASAITATPSVPVAATTPSRPPASRFGVRPSSASTIRPSTSTLRRPSQQTTSSAASGIVGTSAASRPRTAIASETSSTTAPARSPVGANSAIAKPIPTSSLLQRRSFLIPPTGGSATTSSSLRRESLAGPAIASATDTTSLLTRRTSFGFARPASIAALKKP